VAQFGSRFFSNLILMNRTKKLKDELPRGFFAVPVQSNLDSNNAQVAKAPLRIDSMTAEMALFNSEIDLISPKDNLKLPPEPVNEEPIDDEADAEREISDASRQAQTNLKNKLLSLKRLRASFNNTTENTPKGKKEKSRKLTSKVPKRSIFEYEDDDE
jgi:hypothetical protein